MSMFDWLRNLAGAAQQTPASAQAQSHAGKPVTLAADVAASEAAPTLTDDEKLAITVSGLNFMDAITAHQKWKARLTAYLNGTSTEKLDYRVVCRDDQCVLGKWINGSGGDAYGHVSLFSELKMTHGQFHLAAGAIVRMKDEGKAEQAHDALRHGGYPQHSIKVQGLISALYMEVKGHA